jgi:hypothetical protein
VTRTCVYVFAVTARLRCPTCSPIHDGWHVHPPGAGSSSRRPGTRASVTVARRRRSTRAPQRSEHQPAGDASPDAEHATLRLHAARLAGTRADRRVQTGGVPRYPSDPVRSRRVHNRRNALPRCLGRTVGGRSAIVRTRRVFASRCGVATESWRPLGAVVYISGVGFWDFPHGQRGHARNYAELHQVTRIRIIAGCA